MILRCSTKCAKYFVVGCAVPLTKIVEMVNN